MTWKVDQKGQSLPPKKDDADDLLGQRHDYNGAERPDLSRTARNIGFSSGEVSELERVYKPGSGTRKMNSEKKGPVGPNRWLILGGTGLLILIAAIGANSYMSIEKEAGNTTLASLSNEPCALDEAVISKIKAASIGEMKAFAPMDRPYSLVNFSFKDNSGTPKTIADWKGRTVLVNLWATWCAPCRAEMPSLDELQGILGSDKFEVMPISVDRSEPSKPKGFFEEISIKEMGFYHDKDAMTLNALKREGLALGLPATLLVDGRGCAIGRINGPAEWASQDAQTLIKAAL